MFLLLCYFFSSKYILIAYRIKYTYKTTAGKENKKWKKYGEKTDELTGCKIRKSGLH